MTEKPKRLSKFKAIGGVDDFESYQLALQLGVTQEQARALVKTHGLDRPTLEREAAKLKDEA